MTASTKRTTLTYLQRKQIDKVLHTHCKSPEPGVAEYADGWDDHIVAASMPFACSSSGVAKVRKDVFGHLRHATVGGSARIEALEAVVLNLRAKVADLSTRLASLEGGLGI